MASERKGGNDNASITWVSNDGIWSPSYQTIVLPECKLECKHFGHRIVTALTNQPSSDCEHPRQEEGYCEVDIRTGEDRRKRDEVLGYRLLANVASISIIPITQ